MPTKRTAASGQSHGQSTGLLRELKPGPLTPEARIMPLDQAADGIATVQNLRTFRTTAGKACSLSPMFVHWHAIATVTPSPAERGQHVGSDDGNADRQQTQRTTTISGRMGLGREHQGGWFPTGGVLGWRARCFKVHPPNSMRRGKCVPRSVRAAPRASRARMQRARHATTNGIPRACLCPAQILLVRDRWALRNVARNCLQLWISPRLTWDGANDHAQREALTGHMV